MLQPWIDALLKNWPEILLALLPAVVFFAICWWDHKHDNDHWRM